MGRRWPPRRARRSPRTASPEPAPHRGAAATAAPPRHVAPLARRSRHPGLPRRGANSHRMAVTVPASQPFSSHVLDFLAYLEFERALSRNTLEAYRGDLLQFGAFLGRREATATTAHHAALAASLDELAAGDPDAGRPPVAAATLQRKAACLRSFYRHLRREQVIEHDPTADLRAPRKSQRLPQVLTRDEVARLLAAPKGGDPAGLRD